MMRRIRIAAVVAMLVLAGCAGVSDLNPAGSQSGAGGTASLVIDVDSGHLPADEAVSLTRSAVEFWRGTDALSEEDSVAVETDADDPDVVVAFEPRIGTCHGESAATTFSFCSTPGDPDAVTVATPFTEAGTGEATKAAVGAAFGVEEPTARADVASGAELEYDDPWFEPGPVTVAINDTGDGGREYAPLVERALDYWEATDETYGNYTANFTLDPDADDAAVEVRFVDEVADCDTEDDDQVIGCAPLYDGTTVEPDRTVVEIERGYTNETTVRTLKHEFGHVFGRQHGMEPMPVMNETDAGATRLPQPNATERANPWQCQVLTVHVDGESFDADAETVRRQVGYALEYYESRTDGNVTFELTDAAAAANVSITGGELPCRTGDAGSCSETYGRDLDGDGALEHYTGQEIYVDGIDGEAIGWHVGYWLGFSIAGAEDASELPEPFRDADYDDRRDWYE